MLSLTGDMHHWATLTGYSGVPTYEWKLRGGAVYAEYDNVSLAARLTLVFITYDNLLTITMLSCPV